MGPPKPATIKGFLLHQRNPFAPTCTKRIWCITRIAKELSVGVGIVYKVFESALPTSHMMSGMADALEEEWSDD